MIEYVGNAIRATAGEDVCISAKITDNAGEIVDIHSHLMIYDDLALLATIDGVFDGEVWSYSLAADTTRGLQGRYWYCICVANESLCFKQPIYFV